MALDSIAALRSFTGSALQKGGAAGGASSGAMEAFQKASGMDGPGQIIPSKELSQLTGAFKTDSDPASMGGAQSMASALPSFGRVSGRDSFADSLGGLIGDVNARQGVAGEAVRGLIGNQGVSLHQAMIAMEEASVSFQLMVEVRNKLLESYQELMRMQV